MQYINITLFILYVNKLKSIRRIDPKKVRQIQDLRKECIDAELDWEMRIFAEYKGIPDATRLEHLAAKYPIHYLIDGKTKKKIIDPDILRLYNDELRIFNKSLKDRDKEIIGVDHKFQDLEGKEFKICFMQVAEGMKARRAAERTRARINGELAQEKRLLKIADDPDLKKEHDAEWRKIRRLLDRKRKK